MGDITDQVCPRSLAVSFHAFSVCLVRAQSALLVVGVLVLCGCAVVGDATDAQSKRAFLFLQTFIGMRLADPGAAQKAPVITVPVK